MPPFLSLALFLKDILRDSGSEKKKIERAEGSLENAFQMAYPVGSPRGHLGDKPWQEKKIEGGKRKKKEGKVKLEGRHSRD